MCLHRRKEGIVAQQDNLQAYMEAVYNRCFRILRDGDLAWDALQDVFEVYYQACQEKEIHQPMAYLYRMSTNRCLNMLRQSKRTLPLFDDWQGESMDGSRLAEDRLMVDALTQTFGQDVVDLLVYRYVDQMTYGEIAMVVGLSDRGVKKKLDRLESQVREHFAQAS